MKRNMDTVRRILQAFEDYEDGGLFEDRCPASLAEDINEDSYVVLYHMKLLLDAGYLIPDTSPRYWTQGLTMKGHDSLDQIRDQAL